MSPRKPVPHGAAPLRLLVAVYTAAAIVSLVVILLLIGWYRNFD